MDDMEKRPHTALALFFPLLLALLLLPGALAAAPASAEPIPESGAVLILEDTAVPMGDLPETGTAAAENMDPVQLLGMAAVCFSLAAAGLALTIHHKKKKK